MDEEVNGFTLTSRERGEPAPVLRSVTADSRLDGVLFETTLRQTYRNPSDRVLEVVYTFPLPHGTVLLGFASELNGRRQVGTVVARRDAEQRYEAALAEGDAPVMLEALDHGLHTANIGNLQHDDELVLEVRFAQLVSFEQGRLRLALPTTIAPRFGNPLAAGLQPQQVPQASMALDYPLALSLTIGAALAGAKVECPTHACRQMASEGGLRIELKAGAALDRDVVFLVQPREPRPSLLVRASDDRVEPAGSVLMAALQPQGDALPCEAIDLKLLVDCSGSMGGDSIASAQRALLGVLAGLGERDQVSLSRFGHNVEHVQPLAPCRPQLLRQLRLQVGAIAADLGGTVMGAALLAVFRLPAPAGADVLLVTDGEIWEIEQILADARAGGHRVFAIGVGSAPSAGAAAGAGRSHRRGLRVRHPGRGAGGRGAAHAAAHPPAALAQRSGRLGRRGAVADGRAAVAVRRRHGPGVRRTCRRHCLATRAPVGEGCQRPHDRTRTQRSRGTLPRRRTPAHRRCAAPGHRHP